MENFILQSIYERPSSLHAVYHNRASHAFIYKINGESLYRFSGRTITLRQGNILFIPQGESFSVESLCSDESRYLVINFTGTPFRSRPELFPYTSMPAGYDTLKQLYRTWAFRSAPQQYYRCISHFYSLLASLASLSELHYQTASQKALIRESCDYLEAHIFDSSLTVGKLIDISGLSGTYFRKIFSGVCGMSPQKYIESKRLTQAKAIFDSRDFSSVREVAESVGYADPLYFGKLFRKQYGVPPSEYLRSLALTPLSK
ncbi:MAG: helix-turn-helix domain-containing protein [Clostridia bacterium]|nr:helix-turn-helix domain-containing protein [Clostridia bacterium]